MIVNLICEKRKKKSQEVHSTEPETFMKHVLITKFKTEPKIYESKIAVET